MRDADSFEGGSESMREDSAKSPTRLRLRLTRGKGIVLAITLLALFIVIRGDPRTSADIRIDTGDLRYRYLGIPLEYNQMPEPQRSQLLVLAAKSKILRPEWHKCATFPLRGSNNVDSMCRGWYYRASLWTAQDPQLARLILEDVAKYITQTNATEGLPESCFLLSGSVIEPNAVGQIAVKAGWRQDDEVTAYLIQKGYNLPTTAPAK
jgi:hypothetical protein